jgi:hypothetical protein
VKEDEEDVDYKIKIRQASYFDVHKGTIKMSEGDPHKRQKISEESQALMTEESTLKYQNLCLGVKLKEQREEIKKLRIKEDELTQKSRNQEVFLMEFNQKWAKVRGI